MENSEDDSGAHNEPGTRAYRLHNRRRPCDKCRARKVRCQIEDGKQNCRRCAQSQTPCTFEGRSRRTTRQSRTTSVSSSAYSPVVNHASHDDTLGLDSTFGIDQVSSELHSASDRPTIFVATPPVFPHETDVPYDHTQTLGTVATTTQLQFSRSLDDIQGQTSTLSGSSSEADPWLLRHCRFDEHGLRSFYGLQFRNIGGVPNRQKIPVHFIVTPKSTNDTTFDKMMSLRSRLNGLIPASLGIRLVKL